MARKRELSFFTDIQSDEKFEEFLKQNVLLVLDVYQELFGPCTSLRSTLEQQKSRKVIFISYGAIIPQIKNILETYFKKTEEGYKFPGYDFDEYLPFEMEVIQKRQAEEAERLRIEHEIAKAEKFAKLDEIIDLMNKNSSDMGITLFMPHVAKDAFRKTFETAKWLSLVNRAGKMIQITPDMMETLNYNLENPIDERILQEIYYKDIFAVLWYMDPRTPVTEALKEFVKRVSEPIEYAVEGEESVWETLLDPLIIDPNYVEESESGSFQSSVSKSADIVEEVIPEESAVPSNQTLVTQESFSVVGGKPSLIGRPSVRSTLKLQSQSQINMEFGNEGGDGEDDNGLIVIPPAWTPANQNGNAVFMHEFFRYQFDSFLPPIIEPDPPHLCMIFPAKIRAKVLEVCEEHPKGLLNYGFFEGEDFDNFTQLCNSVESFEELEPTGKEKMILKVSKKTSYLALDLANLNPLYVSHTVSEGQDECSMLFNQEQQDDEQ
ncbi:uncharacterized protein [Chironomus tepperi]|uniref:uncharacterized protein n=1 Tax=Chironomus tepperi TaxID=113505 RepID=UPI00391F6BC6